MKRWSFFAPLMLAIMILIVSCGTDNGLLKPDASASESAASAPEPVASTSESDVSSEQGESPAPKPEETAVEVIGTWDCIQEADGQTYIYRFTFRDDGKAEFGAGWYRSEWAGTFSGTYTLEGDTLIADLTMNEDGSAYHSAFTVSAEDGKLSMTLVSGDPLVYLQQVGDTLTYGEREE